MTCTGGASTTNEHVRSVGRGVCVVRCGCGGIGGDRMILHKPRWHEHPHVRSGAELSLGERSADAVRNGMGSWKFIWIQTALVLLWVGANLYLLGRPFDPYPFILLNLMFSVQAAYASPIILLSQRRSDSQSSEIALHTYENGQQILKLTQQNADLTKQVYELTQQQMTILNELRALRAVVDDRGAEEMPDARQADDPQT